MRMFMYRRAAVFGGVLGLFVVGLKAEVSFADSARTLSSDGAVSNSSERRYATKNMLTLAQNEQPTEVQEVSSAVTPEGSSADQKQSSEAGAASVSTDQGSSISTETPSVGDQKPVLVAPDATVQSAAEATAPMPATDASVAASAAVTVPAEVSGVPVASPAEVVTPIAAPVEVLLAEPEVPKKEEKKTERNGTGAKKTDGSDLIGIDTVNIDEPEGNWLYKRKYWEQAEYRYEKVKTLLDKIMDIRMDFFSKQVDADKNFFDPFYLEMGIKEGNVEQIITDLIAYMDKERQEQGALDQEERDFLATVQQERAALEQLRQDVQSINKIDEAIHNAIIIVSNVIDQARGFEKQSWQNFKAIARELSDKKAHNLYYGIETYWQNMKDIHVYMSTQLSSYFQQLISKAQEQIEKVRASMDALKERGVDLKAHAQKMEQAELDKARADQEVLPKPVKQGIVRRIWHWLSSFFGAIGNYAVKAVTSVWQGARVFFGGLFVKKATGESAAIPEAPVAPGEALAGQPAEIVPESGAHAVAPADTDTHADAENVDPAFMQSQAKNESAPLAAS
ncbi:hypothetical protein CVU75_03870 [Candidatus Dependentiae bacterium HGW-Dependentiae-1]|nr:MAG: hypothetical protein CVU75_03870 [Candidatus Dependentiae bacterium HGW-Dependentiae-1]